METKKSKRANLENYRTIFLQIGIILTLSAILFAFEWKTKVELEDLEDSRIDWVDIEEMIPVTRPKAEVIKKVEVPSFMITPDEFEVPDFDPDLFDSEIGINDGIEIIDYGDVEEPEEVEDFVIIAEFMPTFQGKDGKHFRNYIADKVKFPRGAVNNGISGTVFTTFVVDKDGKVINVQILRGVHPVIDEAVLEVIKNSPKWEPGMNNGRLVKVKYTIAIKFELI